MAAEDWIFDMLDPWEEEPYYAGTQRKTCDYCGQDNLHWEQSSRDHKWRLHDHTGRTHRCAGPGVGKSRITRKLAKKEGWSLRDLHQPKRSTIVGLFNRKPIYVSDRGDEYQLDEMEPTHLLNAINHHRKQIDTIDWILEQTGTDADKNQMLHLRRISLHSTVEALIKELRKRDPDQDHEHLF